MTDEVHKNFRKCIVLTCGDTKSSLVHKFPTDNEKANKWRQLVNNPLLNGLPIETVRKKYFICSIHFKPSDYKNVESRSLNTTAFPSLYLEAAPASQVSSQSYTAPPKPAIIQAPQKLINLEQEAKPQILDSFTVDSYDNLPECYSIIEIESSPKLLKSFQAITPVPSKKRMKMTTAPTPNAKKIKSQTPVKIGQATFKVEPKDVEKNLNNTPEPPANKMMALFELTPDQYENINKRLRAGKSLSNLFDLTADNDDDPATGDMDGTCIKLALITETLTLDFFWLRDHCRCILCYNHETFQRKISITDIPDDITILNSTLNDELFNVVWSDQHKSSYSLDFLKLHNSPEIKKESKQFMWNRDEIKGNQEVAKIEMKEYLCDEEASKLVVQSLVRFGVAFVEKCPPNQQSSEFVVRHLFPVQKTLFGEMWTFSDSLDHADTAYTKEYLGPHNDNTYFNDASGLQVLHCIQHQDGTGGDNFLVDGLKVCNQLRLEYPDVFQRLCASNVTCEYIEEDKHHKYSAPIIKLDADGELLQIRYNLYDRAPMGVPLNKVRQFYGDLKVLTKIVENEDNQWRFKLNPGTVMMFDNWRILHGRFAYSGKRTMTGCYVSRTEFQSRARHLKIIV